jgi:hypothetical protein
MRDEHLPEQQMGRANGPVVRQTLPQLPQLAGSVCVFTQALLQTVCPLGQEVSTHWPDTQLCPAVQAVAQAPQLLALVDKLTQAPLQQLVPLEQHVMAPRWPHSRLVLPPQAWHAARQLSTSDLLFATMLQ